MTKSETFVVSLITIAVVLVIGTLLGTAIVTGQHKRDTVVELVRVGADPLEAECVVYSCTYGRNMLILKQTIEDLNNENK